MKYLSKFKHIELQKGKIYIAIKLNHKDGDECLGDIYELVINTKKSPMYKKLPHTKFYSMEWNKYKEFDVLDDLIEYLDDTETSYKLNFIKSVRDKVRYDFENETAEYYREEPDYDDPIESFKRKIYAREYNERDAAGDIVLDYFKNN